jgi:hypothetical protein
MRFRRYISVMGVVPILLFAGPAAAQDMNVGSGGVTGNVTFNNGTGVPVASTACVADNWSFVGSASGVVIDIANNEFVGNLSLASSVPGSSTCAVGGAESGTMSIVADSTNQTSIGHLSCSLSGGYLRLFTHVHVDLRGTCTINLKTDPAEFIAEGEFAPTATHGAATNPYVDHASFAGAFVVAPPF